MGRKILAWIAGLALVLIFMTAVSPDLVRGYVFSEEPRSSGQRVYDTYCIGCHGADGRGVGEAAQFLNPKPRNFVDGDFKFFHFNEPGPLPSDQSLQITIRNGLPGSAMPAFALLTDQEIKDVTTYIKNFRAGGWVQPEPIQAAAGPVQIEGATGEDLFMNAGCNACHQLDALGTVGGVGPSLNGVGSRLTVDEIAQSIREPNAVLAAVCPAGPCPPNVMPQNFAERLSADQIDTLAQFLSEQK
ncbi:MAG: c-type cytochrome [Caldilineaceae bacterium]